MLHMSSTPDGKKPPFSGVLRFGPATPNRVGETIAMQDGGVGQRFVIRFGFAKVSKQFLPTTEVHTTGLDAV